MSSSENVSELAKALSHQERSVRINTVLALGKIGNSEVVEPLLKP